MAQNGLVSRCAYMVQWTGMRLACPLVVVVVVAVATVVIVMSVVVAPMRDAVIVAAVHRSGQSR